MKKRKIGNKDETEIIFFFVAATRCCHCFFFFLFIFFSCVSSFFSHFPDRKIVGFFFFCSQMHTQFFFAAFFSFSANIMEMATDFRLHLYSANNVCAYTILYVVGSFFFLLNFLLLLLYRIYDIIYSKLMQTDVHTLKHDIFVVCRLCMLLFVYPIYCILQSVSKCIIAHVLL